MVLLKYTIKQREAKASEHFAVEVLPWQPVGTARAVVVAHC